MHPQPGAGQSVHTAHMQITLRKDDLNARVPEPLIDLLMQVAFHRHLVVHVPYSHAQFKIQGTVAEAPEQHLRLGEVHHGGMVLRTRGERVHDERHV